MTLWAALLLGAARVLPRVDLKNLFSSFGAGAGGGSFAGSRKTPPDFSAPDFGLHRTPPPIDFPRPRLQLGADQAAIRAVQDQLRQAEVQRMQLQQIQQQLWNQQVQLQQRAAQNQAQTRFDAWPQSGRR